MEPLSLVALGVLGAIVGSFLNVVALRLHVRSFVAGRSACPSCGTTLSALDLLPVFSYLALRGRCRHCRSRISARYPAVELASAGVFLLIGMTATSLPALIMGLISFSLLLLIALYDLEHRIIPDEFVYPFIAVSLVAAGFHAAADPVAAFAAGPALAAPLYLLALLSSGRAMGWGDGTLALGVGWLLGLESAAVALLFSIWIGGAVGILLLLSRRSRFAAEVLGTTMIRMGSEIPFAPFLAAGAMVAYASGLSLSGILAFFA